MSISQTELDIINNILGILPPGTGLESYLRQFNQGELQIIDSIPYAGDTPAQIKSKLGPATATNDGYLLGVDWSNFNGKWTPIFTPENVANKSTDTLLGGASPSNFLYSSQLAVKTYIDAHVSGGYVLPTASTTVLGGVKVDGTSITINGFGVISSSGSYTLPTASTTVLGGVKVDGTSITISGGVISSASSGGTYTSLGTGFSYAGGTISKTLTVLNTISLSGTDSSTLNIGSGGTLNTAAFVAASTLSPVAGSSSITTVGTVGSGTWQGNLIVGQYGGTGVNNTGKTITLGGNLITSGAFATTLTVTNTTVVTLPVSGTLVGSNDTGTVTNTMLAGSIAINKLAASTISGVSLGNNLSALTISTGLSGSSYNGSAGVTIAVNASQNITTLSNLTTDGYVTTTGGVGTLSVVTSIPINKLAASTISGISLGNNLSSLTIGTGLSGSSYNGSTGVTIAINASQNITTLSNLTTDGYITTTGGTGTLSVVTSIPIAKLAASTISGVSLGGTLASLTMNNSGSGATSGSTYTGAIAATISYNTIGAQPLATGLTSIAGLTYASLSFVKMSAANTFSLDTGTYISSLGSNLTSLSGLTYVSGSFVKMTGANTFTLDTASYASLVSPSFTTPSLGVATATSINAISLTAQATGFTIAGGTTSKTLTVSNTLSLAGTDASTLNIGTGGTLSTGAFTTAYSLPAATSSTLGGVKPDGIIITNTAGAITVATATTSAFGVVKPDGTTITISGGIITSTGGYTLPTASTTVLGGVKVDGTTITIAGGVISSSGGYTLPNASTTVLGGVKVDGTSITINGSGVISSSGSYTLPTASTTILGGVKIDGSTIVIDGSGVISSLGGYSLPTASTTVLGGVKVDGTSITIVGGVISSNGGYSLPTASTTVLGGVKVDGTSITISGGIISDAFAIPMAIALG